MSKGKNVFSSTDKNETRLLDQTRMQSERERIDLFVLRLIYQNSLAESTVPVGLPTNSLN